MNAKDKQEFISAWNDHISDFCGLWPKERADYDKLKELQNGLKELVLKIAEGKTFGGKEV